jgi:glycerol-3-phosphate cytidylyltransferase
MTPEQINTVGYTAGVFDLFHMGHLNLLRQARERCGHLIAGITSDELALDLRGSAPVQPLLERMAVVQSMRYVDHVVPQIMADKRSAWETLQFDVLFVGDNLQGTSTWQLVEQRMAQVDVEVVYLRATHTRSGRLLERGLADLVAD